MKLNHIFIAVALAVLSVSAVFVMSSDGSDAATGDYTDGDYTFNVSGDNATIISYTGTNATEINIPSTVSDGTNTYNVTVIGGGSGAIIDNSQLDVNGCTLTIPDTVTNIGIACFSGCNRLTSVTLPDSLTTLGGSAFQNCKGLVSVDLPDTLTAIPGGAFFGCSGLTSVTIPYSVASVGNYAFESCTSVNVLTVYGSPTFGTDSLKMSHCESVLNLGSTTINAGDYGLPATVNIQTITHTITDDYATITALNGNGWDLDYIPDHIVDNGVSYPVKVIGDGTNPVITNDQLTDGANLVIPDSVITLNDKVFYHCAKITTLDLSDNITSIGRYAFRNCTGITGTLDLPDGVILDQGTFTSCSGFTGTLDLSGVRSVPVSVFIGCSGFTGLILDDDTPVIGYDAFKNCSGMIGTLVIPSRINFIGESAFLGTSFDTLVVLGSPEINTDAFSTETIEQVLNLGSTEITTTSYGMNADEVRDDIPAYGVVAPDTVTEVFDNDGAMYDLLRVIPVFVIVAILSGAIALVTLRRD